VVLAVLDWEMSTLGDPLADVALMCIYRDLDTDLIAGAWTSPLLPTADEMAHRYSTISGHPLSHWPFYIALAFFKLGIIAAGVAFRDQLAGEDAYGKRANESIAPLITAGLRALA